MLVLNTHRRGKKKKSKKIHLKLDFPGWKITGAYLGNFIKRRRKGKKSKKRLKVVVREKERVVPDTLERKKN